MDDDGIIKDDDLDEEVAGLDKKVGPDGEEMEEDEEDELGVVEEEESTM